MYNDYFAISYKHNLHIYVSVGYMFTNDTDVLEKGHMLHLL